MTDEARAAQSRLYGAPLHDVFSRCGQVLGLNQAGLAAALGISAPMLSQLMHARRVKIGNPVAAERLQVMHGAVEEVERGALGTVQALARIAAVHEGVDILTTRRATREGAAAQVQELFRRVASATDHLGAADLLHDSYPDIAAMLRVYGAGRADEALAHLSGSPYRPARS